MLLFAAIVSERYRASHRRPIICRDFRVVISSVGASRINWCINVPAILYLSTRDLGSPTRTAQYFGTNTSVIQTRTAQYFGTNTSVFRTRTAQYFGTLKREISQCLQWLNLCTHGLTCTRVSTKPLLGTTSRCFHPVRGALD